MVVEAAGFPDTVLVLPVKLILLKKLPESINTLFAPPVMNKLGALAMVWPVRTLNLLLLFIDELNPPAPVQLKPVPAVIPNTIVSAVVCVKPINPAPNVNTLVRLVLELKIPTDNVTPDTSNVPELKI